MTVTSTNQKVQFNGNGSTTVFAYNFKIFASSDLSVILRSAAGTETVQQLTTNYTVSGVGEASGGNVTMGTAPASGTTLTILRVQPNLQGLDLVPNDPFPAGSMEDALDKLTFMVQTHDEEIGRSIKASKTNVIADSEFTVSATDRANKLFSFDSSGNLSIAQELGTYKGNWAASTTYAVRDLVKDTSTGNIFICVTAHTSSGSQPLTTNTDAAKWALIVDAASATTSQTAAAASATAAANSATASASSASSSSTKADEAAASASTASTKAGEAASSATASASSATSAASSLSTFQSQYHGAASSDPSSNLSTGDLYFNTSSNSLKVYNGSAWVAAAFDTSGALINTNNLSDVSSAATALTNLGVNATAAEINLIDGGTARGTTAIADGDGVLINDAGTMRMTNVQTVKTYMTAGVGGGGTEFISSSGALSNAASAAFTGFDSSKYDHYIFFLQHVIPANDAVMLLAQSSTDNGSSYATTSGDYHSAGTTDTTGFTVAGFGSYTIGSGSNEFGVSGNFMLYAPHNSSAYTYGNCANMTYNSSDGDGYITAMAWGGPSSLQTTGSARIAAEDVDALRFIFTSGNIESGEITMFGIKNA